MFAKLKKKIAEEAAIAPRPGGAARIPRSISKESITSVGADSGDDFVSSALLSVCHCFTGTILSALCELRMLCGASGGVCLNMPMIQ